MPQPWELDWTKAAPAPVATPHIAFTAPQDPAKQAMSAADLTGKTLSNTKAATEAGDDAIIKHSQAVKARSEADAIEAETAIAKMAPNSELHGEDYLKKYVPPAEWNVIRAYARGDIGARSGGMSTSMLPVIQHALNYDPSASGATFAARTKMQQQLSDSNPASIGGALRSMEQMLLHGRDVLHGSGDLDNFHSGIGSGPLNWLRNAYERTNQDPRFTGFDEKARNYTGEAQKAFSGVAGGQEEREGRLGNISTQSSHEANVASLQSDAEMIFGRGTSLNSQYRRVMGKDITDQLSPDAKRAYDEIMAGGYDKQGKPLHPAPGWKPISDPELNTPGAAGGNPPATDPAHTPGGGQVVFNDEMPDKASGSYRLTPTQEAGLVTLAKSGATAEQLQAKYAEYGHPNANIDNLRQVRQFYADPKNRNVDIGFDYSKVDAIKPVDAGDGATGAAVRGAADTASLGLLPRMTAVSEALRNDTPYSKELDKQRGIRGFDSSQHPIAQIGGSLVGGVAVPIGLEARTPGEIARAGATIGTIYGYNSSYGSVPEKLASAAKGGVAGLATGYGIAKGAPALAQAYQRIANRPSAVAARTATAATRQEGADIAAAGQAENVPVNRAMVNPALQNRVTAAEATFGGGPIVRRSMADVARGVEGRVNDLGAGGSALEPVVGGNKVQGAAERYIKQSGAVARRQYDHAEKLAGDIKVPPQEMGTAVGAIITRLSETPSINAPEIAFMKSIENDLGKNLSVGALRRFRTQLRGKISKGELTFGESEADVLGVMDAASRDIEQGLRAAGKGKAADAFHSADAAYRQRMDFIGGTVQKLIGKRNANVSPEATLARFKAMASPKGDVEGLGKMLAIMEPGEAADVAATFASELGRDGKGNFSTAHLLTQVDKLSPTARETIFGKEGAESLGRLVTLANAHNRVFSQLNHAKSGVVAAARDYRSWIAGLIGAGTSAGSNVLTGVAATVGTAGAVATKDLLSARALMSPKIAKWLASAPASASAIPAHIARLGPIAAREPAIANEVVALQQRLTDSFVGPYKAAAGGDDRNDRRPPSGGKQRAQQPTFHMP